MFLNEKWSKRLYSKLTDIGYIYKPAWRFSIISDQRSSSARHLPRGCIDEDQAVLRWRTAHSHGRHEEGRSYGNRFDDANYNKSLRILYALQIIKCLENMAARVHCYQEWIQYFWNWVLCYQTLFSLFPTLSAIVTKYLLTLVYFYSENFE